MKILPTIEKQLSEIQYQKHVKKDEKPTFKQRRLLERQQKTLIDVKNYKNKAKEQ